MAILAAWGLSAAMRERPLPRVLPETITRLSIIAAFALASLPASLFFKDNTCAVARLREAVNTKLPSGAPIPFLSPSRQNDSCQAVWDRAWADFYLGRPLMAWRPDLQPPADSATNEGVILMKTSTRHSIANSLTVRVIARSDYYIFCKISPAP